MRESENERKLIQAVRHAGGLALKFVSPGFNGVPDRLLLFDGGKAAFCEVKAPGQKPGPLQAHRMEQLQRLGFKVFVIDDVNQIGGIMDEICSA
ncbi:MAG: VRR-NUC domain-containing protein [Clostridia bacterium]|nr:VRR-NUC domain-containing protein [Clostridia bacterium]